MKNLLKFTAVVAACTFASCSNDLSELSNTEQPTAANELKIVAEEMGGGSLTRTAYVSESKNDRVWQESDKFQVFGPEIVGKYDYYKYKKSTNKFELDGTKDLAEASYVAFPTENIVGQNWVKEDGAGYITFNIPPTLEYDEVSGTSPVAYISNLPLWGTAKNDGEGIQADVYFLTSIIKVYLTNALNNAQAVRIRAWNNIEGTELANISGISTVKVSEKNVALSPKTVQLANPEWGGSNTITVNLGDLNGKATNSVVYIPLIAGYYGKVVVEYTNDGLNWTEINKYLDKTFERGTPYGKGNEQVFSANVNTISGLNDILANMASSASGEVKLGVQNAITSFNADLTVPAMKNVTKLTLNIPGLNSTGNNLNVKGDFAGTLVLNPTTATMGDLCIQTKNANVVIGGAWGTSAIKFTYAKNVQFGGLLNANEQEITANYSGNAITLGAAVEGVIVAKKATVGAIELGTNHKAAEVNVLGTSGNITVDASELQDATAVKVAGTAGAIQINGSNKATIEVSGTAGNITNNGSGAVTVSGTAGNITNNGSGDITISGNPVYAATGAKKVGAVETKGNVTINLANEGVAIRGGLTFKAAKKLTLTQGYVDAITVNAGNNKTVTCTLGNGYVTLPKPTLTGGSKFTVSNTPAWNGEKIGGSFDTTDEENAIKALVGGANYAKPTDWNTIVDAATDVYTPIGLAMNAGKFTLKNNIDLNNKTWTPAATTGDIDGGGKTIKNIKVAVPADGATAAADAGLGLFTTLAHKVTNLTLDGVTIEAAPYKVGSATAKSVVSNIGALAGQLTAAKEIKYVTIKNIKLSSSNGGGVIGGVIGTNTAAATLTGVVVSGTNTIKGYGDLGGLIGKAAANVTIQKCAKDGVDTNVPAADVASAATVSFSTDYNNTAVTNDLKYLQVGNFIGSAADKTIVITDAADAKPALTYDKSTYAGTTLYQVSTGGTTKSYDIVFDKQTLIGWCGDGAFTTAPNINGKAYQLLTTKPDLNNIAPANQYWLYYINK